MREVFVSYDITMVGYYKSMLDAAGVLSFIRNGNARQEGALSAALAFPVLCVNRDADYESALGLLTPLHAAKPPEGPDWRCGCCHESSPQNFETCCSCGEARAAE
jgi:hypothetical protein